jgi:hypothetical protein
MGRALPRVDKQDAHGARGRALTGRWESVAALELVRRLDEAGASVTRSIAATSDQVRRLLLTAMRINSGAPAYRTINEITEDRALMADVTRRRAERVEIHPSDWPACPACGYPLDPMATAGGFTVHPVCEENSR